MKRREFIVLTGIGATSAGVLSACGHPENKLVPALVPDDQFVPGIDYWKASTCGMCEAGCGIIVRTREHRANKIEGNPASPINQGGLCARGQAGLQELYNPDRLKNPLKRRDERGTGRFDEIAWDGAVDFLLEKLAEISAKPGSKVVVTSRFPSGTIRVAVETLVSSFGSVLLTDENISRDLRASEESIRSSSNFDLSKATCLISFGGRFLEGREWPLWYSRAFAEFRTSGSRGRGRFVHLEPRMSLTASNADEWIPSAPGVEALVALSMAHVIDRDGLAKSTRYHAALEPYSPQVVAELSGISVDKIIALAKEFSQADKPLAVPRTPSPQSREDLRLSASVQLLNGIVNAEDRNELVREATHKDPFEALIRSSSTKHPAGNPTPAKSSPGDIKSNDQGATASTLDSNTWSALLIHHANPVYAGVLKEDAISRIPLIVSFSSFLDETSVFADLILPDHTYLERWDAHSFSSPDGTPGISFARPVISAAFNTRQTADVLLNIGRRLNTTTPASGRFETAEAIVNRVAESLVSKPGEQPDTDAVEHLLERGLCSEETLAHGASKGSEDQSRGRSNSVGQFSALPAVPAPEHSEDFPYTLIGYHSIALGNGCESNLPLLQELPDPLTSVMWGSWIEINPSTAQQIGVQEGDLLEVSTPFGSSRVAALLYPAIRPDVIAIPFGQGHTAGSRYSRGRGVNAIALLAGNDRAPARLTRSGAKSTLIRSGTDEPERLDLKR